MIPSKPLSEAVALAVKLSRGNTSDILRQIRLKTAPGGFTVEASDGTTYITIAGKADGPQNVVDVCVEGKTLNGLLTNLKKDKDQVAFEIDTKAYGNPLKMQVGGRNFKLATMPADSFPATIAAGEEMGAIFLSGEQLDGLAWVANAVSTDETRYNMGGVYFTKGEIVATDTHRLHKVRLAPEESMLFSGILPAPAQSLLQAARKTCGAPSVAMFGYRLPAENDKSLTEAQRDEVRILAAEKNERSPDVDVFAFALGGKGFAVEIRTRTVPGLFPPFASVLPRNTAKIATLSAESFGSALALADKMSTERVRGVTLLSAKQAFAVSVQTGTGGTVFEETLDGQTEVVMEWGMNIPYIREAIDYIEKGKVEIVGTDPASPFVFLSPEYPERYALLMPMRL